MKKTLIALALVAGLTSFAGSAKAGLIFNFSLPGEIGFGTGDTIGGTVTLNSFGTAATSLFVTSDLGGNIPFDPTLNLVNLVVGSHNSFTVSNDGQRVTHFDFGAASDSVLLVMWPGINQYAGIM
jgi:hypothetical protein